MAKAIPIIHIQGPNAIRDTTGNKNWPSNRDPTTTKRCE